MRGTLLGGWMRLWLVLVAMWGTGVAVISLGDVPRSQPWYHEEVLAALRPQSKDLLEGNHLSPRTDSIHARHGLKPTARVSTDTPTGKKLEVSALVTEDELDALLADYKSALEVIVAAKKREHFVSAVKYWLVPSALLLCMGLAVRWIYRGFRDTN